MKEALEFTYASKPHMAQGVFILTQTLSSSLPPSFFYNAPISISNEALKVFMGSKLSHDEHLKISGSHLGSVSFLSFSSFFLSFILSFLASFFPSFFLCFCFFFYPSFLTFFYSFFFFLLSSFWVYFVYYFYLFFERWKVYEQEPDNKRINVVPTINKPKLTPPPPPTPYLSNNNNNNINNYTPSTDLTSILQVFFLLFSSSLLWSFLTFVIGREKEREREDPTATNIFLFFSLSSPSSSSFLPSTSYFCHSHQQRGLLWRGINN